MSNQRMVLIVMVFLTVVSWYGVVNNKKTRIAEYNQYIKNADSYYSKEIYIDAIDNYKKALEMNPSNYDLLVKIFDSYQQLSEENGMEETYESAVELDKSKDTLYIKYADYYLGLSDYSSAYSIISEARNNVKSDEIEERYELLSKKYTESYLGYSEIKTLRNGTIAIKRNDCWGLMTSSMKRIVNTKYDAIGCYSTEEELIPVKLGGKWYYIDTDGYKRQAADADKNYEYMGCFSSSYAPAELNGVYGYVNTDMKEYLFEFDYAGVFESGIAAVKKDGKWKIINDSLQDVTGYEYDNVIMDDYGVCSYNGYYFASKNGKYALYGKDGKQIGSETFDNAKMFVSDQPAAVCQSGKWGFVNTSGEIVIKPEYEDADSFSLGLAPVCKGTLWGYIEDDNTFRIECKFKSAGPVYDSGYAITVDDTDMYVAIKFITLP